MRSGRFAQQWLSYRAEVLPPNASSVQVSECRRAFYAGAQALRAEFYKTPNDLQGEAAALLALEEELDQFGRDVKAGVA